MFADRLIKNLASKDPSVENPSAWFATKDGVEKNKIDFLEILTKPFLGRRCQFFDFGEIPRSCVDDEYSAALPAWCEGFLKLPAPVCFFTWSSSASPDEDFVSGHTEGLLLVETYYTDHEALGVAIQRFEARPNTSEITRSGDAELLYGQKGNSSVLVPASPSYQPSMSLLIKAAMPLFVMLGRLNAEGIEKSVIFPPEKLNRRRKKRNQPELIVHTTVRVAPYRAPLGRSGPREGKDFTPPRHHFRRGHIRRFQNGEKTWVRSCFVGSPTDGSVQHDYIVNT